MPKVAIVGYGYVGKAYHKMFPDAVIYDPHLDLPIGPQGLSHNSKANVNNCDLALVCVPTNLLPTGELDMSIVEEVVDWLETPLILIKSALQPGTVDRLVQKTGKKIAVSVELVGMGTYYVPPQYPDPKDPTKHQTIIVGGELDTATRCAEVLWSRMSPTVRINLVSALEAEITKLVENSYPALKVTFQNVLMSLAQKSGANYIRIHQAWASDTRVDSFHQRAVSFNRGWKSHCWSKDVPALAHYANQVGATDMAKLFETVLELNEGHLSENTS